MVILTLTGLLLTPVAGSLLTGTKAMPVNFMYIFYRLRVLLMVDYMLVLVLLDT